VSDLPCLFSVPGSHQDAAARSLRVKNLPEDTQEPLLQQVFEKLVPVKRVEIFVDSGEAVVELVNSAVCWATSLKMFDERLTVVCHDRMLEGCSCRLTLSNLEVNSWKSQKNT